MPNKFEYNFIITTPKLNHI